MTLGIYRRILTFTGAMMMACSAPSFAEATDIPAKSIKLVVGFAPGGATDTLARLVANRLAENMGRTVYVENRPGAGGNIAHKMVAQQSPADGSVILLASIGPMAVAPHLSEVGFDPLTELAPLSMGVSFPSVLVVSGASSITTFQQLLADIKKHPGARNYAHTGVGSASHMTGELLSSGAELKIEPIAYKGSSNLMPDLVEGRVLSYFSAPVAALSLIQAGTLRPLATTGLERLESLPDVPTIAESGLDKFEAINWYGFVAPAKTPTSILDKWNHELRRVLESEDILQELRAIGMYANAGTRQEFADFIRQESDMYASIIRDRGLSTQK